MAHQNSPSPGTGKSVRWRRAAAQPTRFVLVGLLNTGLSYAVYAACVAAGVPYWLANFIALICGIVCGFFMQGALVFGNRDSRRVGRFLLIWLIIYICQTFAIGLLVSRGLSASAAGLLVLPGTAMASYVVQKYFVFRGSRATKLGASEGPDK